VKYLKKINRLINLKRVFLVHLYVFRIIIFLIFCSIITTNAQDKNISFKHLTIDDGLSQNAVFAILQDSKGFMWFGTKDGLNRYDGYSFKVFYHNPFDSSSISDNYITSLFEDSKGRIWIGSVDGKINIYNYENDTFFHIDLLEHSKKLTKSLISSIIEDNDSSIWIGTAGNGLFRITNYDDNLSSYKIVQFKNNPDSPATLSEDYITYLLVDSEEVFWIGSANMLERFNKSDQSFTHFKILTKNKSASNDRMENAVVSIYETNDKKLWLGTLSGLVLFDRITGRYKLYPNQFALYRFGWGGINEITEDRSGKLWLATSTGLMSFDRVSISYSYYNHSPLEPKSLSYNIVPCVWQDKTGVLWFGTSGGGINIYDPKASRFSTLIREKDNSSRVSGFSVRSVLEDRAGNIWISTDVLYKWNRKTGRLKSYEADSDSLEKFGNTGAWSMIQSSSGKIWIGTTEGLYRYDPLSGSYRQYKYSSANKSGLPQKEVFTVYEDREGNIWIITENYLSKLINIEEGIFQSFVYVNDPSNSERVRPVLYEGFNQQLWIGTKYGLLQFDKRTEKFTAYRNTPSLPTSLNNNFIKSICPDPFEPERIIWIGTAGGGLNQFNTKTKTFKHFTENEGLPNNVVYGILPDEKGNLWLSTNKGLSRYNITTNTFRNYDVNDGLQSNEFNTGAYFKSKSGELFFGGIRGLNYFYPETILDNPFKPEIVITDFKIFNRSGTSTHEKDISQKPVSEMEYIELSYDDNFIQFDFASLDYSAPDKNQYAYMLENFNEDWIYSGTDRTATYTNLSPGEYIFRVKGSNNDGVWNEEGTSLRLTIFPPWWSTWWSYFLYGFVIIGVLYLIRRYELNRLRLKNQLKVEKVQSNTLRQVDQMKSRFFTNISHEFRTPLTLILGQIDSLQSSIKNHKDRGKLQVAYKNAQRVLRLINQLLDLSKLEVGSMELKAQRQNLITFIKSLFYSFESLAEKKHITLSLKSEFNVIFVDIDPEKMEKVFYNLLSNAFKFTPDGGKISLNISLVENNFVDLQVKDTGIGISEARIPHIFNRFYQVDGSPTREQEGSGIGLALAKELIELHKGKILVKSNEGNGTEFTVRIPLSRDKTLSDESTKQVEQTQKKSFNEDSGGLDTLTEYDVTEIKEETETDLINSDDIKRQIVLVVEDNYDVREYVCEQLKNNYSVVQAANGLEGISKAQNVIPDLIITDVMMPKMDGIEFCKEIRKNEKTSHIPIIMLTAKAGLDDKIEGLETGIDAYLTKPFSAKELLVRISNLIHQREQLRKRFSNKTIIKPSDVTVASVDQTFLEKVLVTVEKNIEDEQFNVEKLAEQVYMSVSQLNRKLHALIGQPAGRLIRSMRLNRAADLLKQNAGSVAEICYLAGFSDQSYFTRSFKKQFGFTPSEFKKQ
jgi:signal transduction histidine kinase/ligand-binding sensor domain-containing protein/DNA-binding response OmpR family regulator